MSQPEDDVDQQVTDWSLDHEGYCSDEGVAGDDGKEKEKDVAAAAADGEKEKEVIDLDSEEGKQRKEMSTRSTIWEHFIKNQREWCGGEGKVQVLQCRDQSTSSS